jgi:hypothetical protein
MTELPTTSSPTREAGTSPVPSPAQATVAPALITEEQLLLSTAAAVALPPAKTRRLSDAVHAVVSALRAMFASSEKPHARKHYPKQYGYLENSLMSREMDRL